jgi:hypothetical protein
LRECPTFCPQSPLAVNTGFEGLFPSTYVGDYDDSMICNNHRSRESVYRSPFR